MRSSALRRAAAAAAAGGGSGASRRHHIIASSSKALAKTTGNINNKIMMSKIVLSTSTSALSTLTGTVAATTDPAIAAKQQQQQQRRGDDPNPPNRVAVSISGGEAPFKKLLACNRGEIAVRVSRAAAELGIGTVAIYSHEDRFTQHRYKADQAFPLDASKSPVGQYLDIETIINICKTNGIDALHPGYGFLSENPALAR